MSATTSPVDLAVSIAPGVEQDPEVEKAITAATSTFIDLLRQHRFDPAKRELMWGTIGEPPFQHVVAHLRESDEYGSRPAQRTFSRQRLLDPVNRKGVVIDLLLDVRGQKREKIGQAVRRGIDELEQQEETDGHPE
jgi:hypothetical protein